ncbi:MAG: four helix bundle protein [Bacteroidota bacterium]|nr:four helix bundle protein [Odoribacter sp.]MDP3642377.1 four helix bundle protein [Bacteroidota bacterium]
MSESILKQKSYLFALKIVKAYKQIITEHKEYVLSKQLLKAGTSIGANIHEAEFAQSKSDFISKLSISFYPVKSFQNGRILFRIYLAEYNR